jgi:hypothetical protein
MRSCRESDLNQRALASADSSARSCETRGCIDNLHYVTGSSADELLSDAGLAMGKEAYTRVPLAGIDSTP